MTALWRAQLLPADGGGLLSQEQIKSLLDSQGETFDFVPLIISEFPTMNPDRVYGQVKALEMVTDGLDVIVLASDPGSALLRADKTLRAAGQVGLNFVGGGVSWPVTLISILATSRHRITSLRGFEEVG